MSVKEPRTCYIATCDGCKEEYDNGEYTPHWPDPGGAIDEAVSYSDWWHDGKDLLLCNDCRHEPHDAVPEAGDPETCDRCGNPADEHEPAPEVRP